MSPDPFIAIFVNVRQSENVNSNAELFDYRCDQRIQRFADSIGIPSFTFSVNHLESLQAPILSPINDSDICQDCDGCAIS